MVRRVLPAVVMIGIVALLAGVFAGGCGKKPSAEASAIERVNDYLEALRKADVAAIQGNLARPVEGTNQGLIDKAKQLQSQQGRLRRWFVRKTTIDPMETQVVANMALVTTKGVYIVDFDVRNETGAWAIWYINTAETVKFAEMDRRALLNSIIYRGMIGQVHSGSGIGQ